MGQSKRMQRKNLLQLGRNDNSEGKKTQALIKKKHNRVSGRKVFPEAPGKQWFQFVHSHYPTLSQDERTLDREEKMISRN